MAKQCTKAAANIYCQARIAASKYNDKYKSREGASEDVGVCKDALAKYELDIISPPVDVVCMMADAYNAPELKDDYCVNRCPIGLRSGRSALQVKSLEAHALRVVMTTKDINVLRDELIAIAQDGVIDESEKSKFQAIINNLNELEQAAQELKLWAEKNL